MIRKGLVADSIETPIFDLLGVRVFATRAGDHVTGRVTFPPYQGGIPGGNASSPRPSVPIDYHSVRPTPPPPPKGETSHATNVADNSPPYQGGDGEVSSSNATDRFRPAPPPSSKGKTSSATDGGNNSPPYQGGVGGVSSSDLRVAHRQEAVAAYLRALHDRGPIPKGEISVRIAALFNVSPRSIQLWARRFETAGLAGLVDRYTPAPSTVVVCSSPQALDAMRICAWWCFRIANLKCIDYRALFSTLDLLGRGFAVADVLATIDRYFSYACDRERMPFKPFSKWVRYDFEVWLHRACADAEYLREVTESRQRDAVPLQAPANRRRPAIPNARTRRRLANNRASRSGIARLDQPVPPPPPTSARESGAPTPPLSKGGPGGYRSSARSPESSAAVVTPPPTSGHGSSAPTPPLSKGGAGGYPSPATVTEAVQALEDGYRVMLWRAAKGDRQARREARATLPLWWPAMPAAIRRNLESRTAAWSADHPGATAAHLAGRKLDMFLAALTRDRLGPQRLRVAQALSG